MRYHVSVDGQRYEVEIVETDGSPRLTVNGSEIAVDLKQVNAPSLYSLLMANHSYELLVEERETGYAVFLETELYEAKVQSEREVRLARARKGTGWSRDGETEIKAPMPGLVRTVEVEPGVQVAKGKGLVILEAMKMENEIRAPRDGTIKWVAVTAGQTVNKGDLMVVIE